MSTVQESTPPSIGQPIGRPFAELFTKFCHSLGDEPIWLKNQRLEAFARYAARGLPNRRDESWKYTSLRPLAEHDFTLGAQGSFRPGFPKTSLAPFLGPNDWTLVTVDGQPAPELSNAPLLPAGGGLTAHLAEQAPSMVLPKGVRIVALRDACKQRGDSVQRLLDLPQAASSGVLNDLGLAFLDEGYLIEVAAGVGLDRPLHIVHAATGAWEKPAAFFPRIFLTLGAGARAEVMETHVGFAPTPYLMRPTTTINLGEGAFLRYGRVQADGPQALHLGSTNAELARQSSLLAMTFSAGSRLCRLDQSVRLGGEGANLDMFGLYLGKGDQHVDHHTLIDHAVPNATSRQVYKGIAGGHARAVFNGKVLVRAGAHGTSANQLNRNLLLSRDAEIDTKPELQIDADDVKCAHGATVGQLNAQQLFYLQSRGLRRGDAERLLINAFADEVLFSDAAQGLRSRLQPMTREFFR